VLEKVALRCSRMEKNFRGGGVEKKPCYSNWNFLSVLKDKEFVFYLEANSRRGSLQGGRERGGEGGGGVVLFVGPQKA